MKEKIILKSANPAEYGDLEIECKVIQNEEIGTYLSTVSEEKSCVAYKSGHVHARKGIPGEVITTTIYVTVDGRKYILTEETTTVKERDGQVDWVVTNTSSTSNEQYVVKGAKMLSTYQMAAEPTTNEYGIEFVPTYDPRVLTQLDENVIIVTAWGSKAVGLKGGYIVTYNAEQNDYNVLDEEACLYTYTKEQTGLQKTIK